MGVGSITYDKNTILVRLHNKNNNLDLDRGVRRVHASLLENGHDRRHQASPEAVGGAEGAEALPPEPRERHRQSRSLGQQPRPAAADNADEQDRLRPALDGPPHQNASPKSPCVAGKRRTSRATSPPRAF